MQLNSDEKKTLLALSRFTLENLHGHLSQTVLSNFTSDPTRLTPVLLENHPCFVTLTVKKDGALRGCIGTMTTYNSLYKNVHYFTRQAALADPRFDPVESHEAPDLAIHISVLSPMQPLASIDDLKIGSQGLYVSNGKRHGVLLATVASEYGWNPREFLKNTCHKAGLDPEKVSEYEVNYFDQIEFGDPASLRYAGPGPASR